MLLNKGKEKGKGQIPENADCYRTQKENTVKLFGILNKMEEEMSFIKHEQIVTGWKQAEKKKEQNK